MLVAAGAKGGVLSLCCTKSLCIWLGCEPDDPIVANETKSRGGATPAFSKSVLAAWAIICKSGVEIPPQAHRSTSKSASTDVLPAPVVDVLPVPVVDDVAVDAAFAAASFC